MGKWHWETLADPEIEEEPPKFIGLYLNGNRVVDDVGALPVYVQATASLCWDDAGRRVALQYKIMNTSADACDVPDVADVTWKDSDANFYTTNVKFESAKDLYVRGKG